MGAPLQAKAVKTYRESEGGTYKKLLPAEVGWKSGRRHDKPALWLWPWLWALLPSSLAGRGVDWLPTIQARARDGTSRRQPSGGLHPEQHEDNTLSSQQQDLLARLLYLIPSRRHQRLAHASQPDDGGHVCSCAPVLRAQQARAASTSRIRPTCRFETRWSLQLGETTPPYF